MLQSQGVRLLDPYSTLQVQPHATHELIVEAYWALVAREKSRLGSSVAAALRIRDLNAAYALLTDEGSRATYDRENGLSDVKAPRVRLLRVRKGWFSDEFEAALTDGSDYYALLGIDREADADIIDVAYHTAIRQAGGPGLRETCLRELLTRAHQTLSNPQLRAQYDGSRTRARHGIASRLALLKSRHAPGEDEAAHEDPAPADGMIDAQERPSDGVAADAAADAAQNDGAPPVAAGVEFDPDGPAAVPDGAAAATAGTTVKRRRTDGIIGRLRARQPDGSAGDGSPARPSVPNGREAVEQAELARLLELREEPEPGALQPVPSESPDRPTEQYVSDAYLEIRGGSTLPRTVALADGELTIGMSPSNDIALTGDGIEPYHARIWRHGDDYVFRLEDRAAAAVNGATLEVPLVFLEDGDAIEVGAYRLTIRATRP